MKLAIFYDWIFFNPPGDNIMSLEPAALLINHSLSQHPQVGATLLDFLARLVTNFHHNSSEQILNNITASFKHVKETGVVSRLKPLLFNASLNPGLKKFLKSTFESLYLLESPPVQKAVVIPSIVSMPVSLPSSDEDPSVPTAQFSDDENNSDEGNQVIKESSPLKKVEG